MLINSWLIHRVLQALNAAQQEIVSMKLKQIEFEREMKLQLQRQHDALTQKHNDELAALLNEKNDLQSRYDGVCNQVMVILSQSRSMH